MSEVTICVPYRPDTDHRAALADWQWDYLGATYPGVQRVRCDDGQPDGPFNRSRALNRARDLAFTDWLWCLDTDAAPAPDDLAAGLHAAQATGWAVVYAGVHRRLALRREARAGASAIGAPGGQTP